MKNYLFFSAIAASLLLVSCTASKTYFTPAIRTRVETNGVPLEKVQFYVDRDIVLKREMDQGETKITSGTLKFQNGHYVNIITLKKGTPGVCIKNGPDKVSISFEMGEGRSLTFGKTRAGATNDPYRILADDWVKDYGVVTYEGKQYHIESTGTEASIMIKTSWLKVTKVDKRLMKGRTVNQGSN